MLEKTVFVLCTWALGVLCLLGIARTTEASNYRTTEASDYTPIMVGDIFILIPHFFSFPTEAVQASGEVVVKNDKGGLTDPPWVTTIKYKAESWKPCRTQRTCVLGVCFDKEIDCRGGVYFSSEELVSIEKAIQILSNWFLNPGVRECALNNTISSLKTTNTAEDTCRTDCLLGLCFEHFLDQVVDCRSRPEVILSEADFNTFVHKTLTGYYDNIATGKFNRTPVIHIRKHIEECTNKLTAEGCASIVVVKKDLTFALPRDNPNHGEFTVYLRDIGTPSNNFKVSYDHLAGLIVHEIMHQMGHTHTEDGSGNDRQDDFTYHFGKCVEFRGGLSASDLGRYRADFDPVEPHLGCPDGTENCRSLPFRSNFVFGDGRSYYKYLDGCYQSEYGTCYCGLSYPTPDYYHTKSLPTLRAYAGMCP